MKFPPLPPQNYPAARRRATLREGPGLKNPPRELELQAALYAGDFGLTWRGTEGEAVEIVHFGEWNREPGPDFVGACLRIDGREFRGDIEIDREDVDWERHGHASNPSFEDVVLHVFFNTSRRRFFTKTPAHRQVVQVCLGEDFPRRRRPSSQTGGPPGEIGDVLEAAARYRLSVKRERWLRAVALHGEPGALFQGAAVALGYKNNKIPFLLTAQRTGLERVRQWDGEALLFGVAGFLDAANFDNAAAPARGYARGLWDVWWRMRDRDSRLVLPPGTWTFAAIRPANHPHRRLGALHALAGILPDCVSDLKTTSAGKFVGQLTELGHPFWEEHATLAGTRFKHPCALIGEDRAVEMAANLLAPSKPLEEGLDILKSLYPVNLSSKIRRAGSWLGIPAPEIPALARSAMAQQGLLQLYEDFFPSDPLKTLEAIRTGKPVED